MGLAVLFVLVNIIHRDLPGGAVIYLDANPNLDKVLDKVESASGEVLQTKKPISEEHGFMSLFLDSEGNRIALNSMT